MDDALGVGGGQPVSRLDRVVEGLARGKRAMEPVTHRLAFEQLADDVGDAIVAAHVVEGDQIRMVEGAGGPRFLLEASEAVVVLSDGGGQDLDRDRASQAGIAGPVDLAHAADSEHADDFVWAEALAARQHHVGGQDYSVGAGRGLQGTGCDGCQCPEESV